jgi:hypothetical protein
VLVQGRALSRRIGGIDEARIAQSVARIGGAALGMGLAVWGAYGATTALIEPTSFASELVIVMVPVVIGGISYLGLCLWLKVEELDYVRSIAGRRFSRNK